MDDWTDLWGSGGLVYLHTLCLFNISTKNNNMNLTSSSKGFCTIECSCPDDPRSTASPTDELKTISLH